MLSCQFDHLPSVRLTVFISSVQSCEPSVLYFTKLRHGRGIFDFRNVLCGWSQVTSKKSAHLNKWHSWWNAWRKNCVSIAYWQYSWFACLMSWRPRTVIQKSIWSNMTVGLIDLVLHCYRMPTTIFKYYEIRFHLFKWDNKKSDGWTTPRCHRPSVYDDIRRFLIY